MAITENDIPDEYTNLISFEPERKGKLEYYITVKDSSGNEKTFNIYMLRYYNLDKKFLKRMLAREQNIT